MDTLAKESGMDKNAVEDLFSDFVKYATPSGELEQKAFQRFINHLCPKRTLVESDLDAWWRQVSSVQSSTSASGGLLPSVKSQDKEKEEWAGAALSKKKDGKSV